MLNRHSLASHLQLYFIKIKLCGKLKVNQLIYIYFNCMFVLFRTGLCQDDVQLVYNYLTTKLFPASLSLNPEGRSVKIEKILTKLNWLQKIFLKIFDRAYRCSWPCVGHAHPPRLFESQSSHSRWMSTDCLSSYGGDNMPVHIGLNRTRSGIFCITGCYTGTENSRALGGCSRTSAFAENAVLSEHGNRFHSISVF